VHRLGDLLRGPALTHQFERLQFAVGQSVDRRTPHFRPPTDQATQQDIGLAVRPALDSWRQKGPTVGGGYGEPEHFRIAAYYAISDLSAARRWIFERASPVLVVTRMAASWSDTTPVGQLVPIDFYGPATPDPWVTALHLWCLWGWDDRPTLGNLFRNSWGTSYGRNGNAYMTTEQWDRAFIEAWGVESVR